IGKLFQMARSTPLLDEAGVLQRIALLAGADRHGGARTAGHVTVTARVAIDAPLNLDLHAVDGTARAGRRRIAVIATRGAFLVGIVAGDVGVLGGLAVAVRIRAAGAVVPARLTGGALAVTGQALTGRGLDVAGGAFFRLGCTGAVSLHRHA